ncbi:transcriptional regulator, TetR family [Frankia torreyi]|uniref:Transcriptional regulator, TetR family n=1 Tax=Frankia torreyi TaxID=1856 RepID=A0A0D8BFI5_9ACTN|nr:MULTISPECIES: TetR/AcrR family transcriptional regulator [Frankia]KJE22714.1 transcriptional regulator, TetR family [Frankia torreyi]
MARTRPARWGDHAPTTEDEARERILLAAMRCYLRHGVARTTVEDIAREALIHRTTVYAYFRSRDEVLAGVVLLEARGLMAASDRIMSGDGRFEDRLVDAFLAARRAVAQSPFLSLLFDRDNAAQTVGAAYASGVIQQRTLPTLTGYIATAQENGELRDDVGAPAMARWLLRVQNMLMTDPPEDSDAVEATLRMFVVASIAPRPPHRSAT